MRLKYAILLIIALALFAQTPDSLEVIDKVIDMGKTIQSDDVPSKEKGEHQVKSHSPIECYQTGNQLYKDEKFAEAADFYKSAIDNGFSDADVYYNLGNAYFKNDNIAHAIIAFERAYYLNPRDEDIQNNLDYARLYTQDKISSIYDGSFLGTFWNVIRMVTYSELIVAIIIIITLATVLLFIQLIMIKSRKKVLLRLSIFFFILGVLASGLYCTKLNDHWLLDSGIITSNSVDVQSSPTESGELLFTLHPGTKVIVKEEYADFVRVAITDGREGWIPSSGITMIFDDDE